MRHCSQDREADTDIPQSVMARTARCQKLAPAYDVRLGTARISETAPFSGAQILLVFLSHSLSFFRCPISLYNGSVIFGSIELPTSKSPAGWGPPYGDRTTGRAGGPVLILRVMKWGLRAGDPFR